MNPFHHHHHHSREDDDDAQRHHYPPPDHHPSPPPFYSADEHHGPPYPPQQPEPYGPPPPGIQHVSHDRGYSYDRPPEPYPPPFSPYAPPPAPVIQHVSHDRGYGYDRPPEPYPPVVGHHGGGDVSEGHHHHHHHLPHWPHHEPPRPAGVEHVSHENEERPKPRQQTFRIYTKADENFSLSIRNGQVILARNNPNDELQHWIKDMTYSTKVKDEEGCPAFSLINKVTGEAIKHSIGHGHPVRLVKYNPDYLDESVLWAESKDVGHGFRCIRMVNNIRLNFDAFNGDKDHGGVKDGTIIVLWDWWKGDNQKWKIVPH